MLFIYHKYIIFQYQVFHFIPCFDHISEASLLKLKVLLAMISYTDIPYILISEDYIHILENYHHIPDFLSQGEKQMIIDKYPYLHSMSVPVSTNNPSLPFAENLPVPVLEAR